MTITRRGFHKIALALMASCGAVPVAQASTSLARIALNRLTFGCTLEAEQAFDAAGLEAWLDQQLAMPATSPALANRLSKTLLQIEYGADKDDAGHSWPARDEKMPLTYLNAASDALYPLTDFEQHGMSYEERVRPAREVQAARLIRAVHGDAQLREVMTQFWHDHFNVNSARDQNTAAYFPLYDNVMRENAFGNFRKFLGEVVRQPSMLYYLNNNDSRASPANENFARELMELHTLGAMNYVNDSTTVWSKVPGAKQGLAKAYIDQDVYEAARAFTGWSVADGHYITEGENAPKTGAFHYTDRWHDPYQKRVLGVEFKANAAPMDDGERLMDILAAHEGTARFICTKLIRRLLMDEPPPALLVLASAHWLKHWKSPNQIASTIKLIVLSPEFAATLPSKLKRPNEFLFSYLRALGAEITATGTDYVWMLARAGWFQHEYRPPTGHPDVAEFWANTNALSNTTDMALNALEEWAKIASFDTNTLVPPGANTTAAVIDHISLKLTGAKPTGDMRKQMLSAIENDEMSTLPEKPEDRAWVVKSLAAMLALSPVFLYR